MSQMQTGRAVKRKVTLPLIVLVILAVGAFVTWWTATNADRKMRRELLDGAWAAARMVDAGHVLSLLGSAVDKELPDYLHLKDELARARHATRQCRFVYLMGRKSDGTIFFYADSEPPGSIDESPPGQHYDEASDGVQHVFSTSQEMVEGPIRDRWGTWVSAFVPLPDPQRPDTPVVLGMDVDARDWAMGLAAGSAIPAALTLALLIALGSVFLAARRAALPCADRPVLRRLMLPLAGASALLVCGFGTAMLWHEKRHLDAAISSNIAAIPEDFSRVLTLEADTLRVALRFLTDVPEMRAALKVRDRQRLLLQHRALFDTLRREHGITHLYFHGPDRVGVLRVHEPDLYGDVIDRFTTCEAQRTGRTVAGIELGPLGMFCLRVVAPVFDEDGLIGFVELGKEIEGVLAGLGSKSAIDIAVIVRKDLLDRRAWETSMTSLRRDANWDRFPDDVLIYSSLPQWPVAFDPCLNERSPTDVGAKVDVPVDGRSRRIAFLPLVDVSESEVGHFIVFYDTSNDCRMFARLLCITGAGCVLLLALLFGLFYVVLKKTDQGIEARALALRESEAKWRSITESSADCIMLLSSNLEILFINRTLPDLGLEPLCGGSILDFLPVESRHSATACFDQVLRTGKPAGYVGELPLPDGRIAFLESSVGPVLCDGEVTGLVVCARDVSDRKRTEEALREESLFRKAIITNAAEGLCVCHEIPNAPFWRFTVWNDRMAEITGYTVEQINDLAWHQLFPADGRSRAQAAGRLRRMRQGEEVRNQEWTIVRRDGQERTLLVSSSLLVSNLSQTHVLALVQDITERKRAEEQLREVLARTERINRLMEGRETRVVGLKRRINELSVAAGQSPPYESVQEGDMSDPQAEPFVAETSHPLATAAPRADHRIEDLLDQDQMQQLLDSYCDAVGISSAIIDPDGKVFVGARWRRLCTDFHRVHPQTGARCIESDTILAGQLKEGEAFSLYRCRNGLTDAASPIIIDGRHVANVFVGQFLLEPADEEFFRNQAKEFSFEEAAYLEALAHVPIVSQQELPAILNYLTTCARLLAEMGLERIQAREYEANLVRQAEELNVANESAQRQREAALSLAEDANEARAAMERVQQSLRESEAKYRSLVDNSLVGIGISQGDRIVYANRSLLAMYGYDDLAEFASRSFLDYLTPASRTYIQEWSECWRRGEDVPYVFEHDIVRKDGAIRRLQLNVTPIAAGDTVCMQTAFVDITERMRAEEALQRSEERLRTVIAAARDAIVMMGPAGEVSLWSPGAEAMFGWTAEEAMGRPVHRLLAPERFLDAHAKGFRSFQATGQGAAVGRTLEIDARHKDGHEFPVELSLSSIWQADGWCAVGIIRDIGERRQLQKCVQSQLQLLQTLMDAIPDGVYYKDTGLRYLGCNRSFAKLLGVSEDRIIGKTIHDIASADLADRYQAADLELLTHPGFQTYEGVVESADGVRHPVFFRKATFQNAEGGIGGIVGVAVDTTDLARAEEALLVKDSALNSATNGIVLTDLEGRLTYANPASLTMWGFDHEQEVLGTPIGLHLRSTEEGAAAVQSALRTGTWRGELVGRRKNGSTFIVQASISLVKDKHGKPVALMASLVDITESTRLHEILDYKQKNLEAIFDAAPLGMLLVNERRRVARANDTIRQMSGKEYCEILNRHPCQVLACTHATSESVEDICCRSCETCSLQSLLDTAFQSGSPTRGSEIQPTLLRKDKQVRPWFSLSLEPVDVNGDKHVLVALHDISRRKEAEEQLRETMELKSQFISTVSHELRTPLTAMREAVVIVADGLAGKLSKDQARFLDIAKRNIERLGRLIDDVLDFQKLSAGKMKFHMESHHIDKAIDEAYHTMLPQAQQKHVQLSVEMESGLPPMLCDRDRIIQVLTNLLSNAIKFTPEGGRVWIRAARQGEFLALRVADTGMGIPKEALPRLFTQFYRVHRPGKEIKGTGLGLAIVSRLVAGHDGRIEVESEIDKGTTFTVLLPLAPKAPADAMPQPADVHLETTLTNRTQA
ncbi:MAG: PAS domain S-box protein [Sedimentisphaerales bacterium]|nr:PAS domain S-box protein [Sedimentisphaerales bacterium]